MGPRAFFLDGRGEMRQQLTAALVALRRNQTARSRHQAARARHDMLSWQVERRKRTRHLIELGSLVVKSGIVGPDRRRPRHRPGRATLDGRQAQKRSARPGPRALGRDGEASVREIAQATLIIAPGNSRPCELAVRSIRRKARLYFTESVLLSRSKLAPAQGAFGDQLSGPSSSGKSRLGISGSAFPAMP